MANFTLSCPRCQQAITCAEQYRGRQVKCPKCGNTISLPLVAASPSSTTKTPPRTGPQLPSRESSLTSSGTGADPTDVPASSQWYYQVMGTALGPLGDSKFRELARDGTIGPDTLVRSGEQDWISADRVPGLFDRGSARVQTTARVGGPGGRSDSSDTSRLATTRRWPTKVLVVWSWVVLVLSGVLSIFALIMLISPRQDPPPAGAILILALFNCIAWNWIRKDPGAARAVLVWLVGIQAVVAALDTLLAHVHGPRYFDSVKNDLFGLWIVFPLANAVPFVIAWMAPRRG